MQRVYLKTDIIILVDNIVQNLIDSRINTNPTITEEEKSKLLLFYYIKENFRSNVTYLNTLNFTYEYMGFIPMRRNIRNSFEAFIDLYNLTDNSEYIKILKYAHKSDGKYMLDEIPSEYEWVHSNTANGNKPPHFLSLYEKYKIFKRNHGAIRFIYNEEPIEICAYVKSVCDEAVHPDVFIKQYTKQTDKKDLLLKLLRIDYFCIKEALDILIKDHEFPMLYFTNNQTPILYNSITSKQYFDSYMSSYYEALLTGNVFVNKSNIFLESL